LLAEAQGETRRTRPLVCLWIQPRMIKEAVVDCGRMVGRVRVVYKNHVWIALSQSSRRDSPRRVV
jgi:hypothetical protein